MKKLYFSVVIAAMFISGIRVSAQVFAHPGATWVFHGPGGLGFCPQIYEIWEYTGDTMINGQSSKIISTTSKWSAPWDTSFYYPATYGAHYFKVSGDTVSILDPSDTSWVELYNFSVGIGDSVTSPIDNFLNTLSAMCPDSLPYTSTGVVTDTGTTLLYGENLRYYTIEYINSQSGSTSTVTYYERLITQGYWYPSPYVCNITDWCDPPGLFCYKDNDMMTDSICADVSWIEVLSVPTLPEASNVNIFPNPVSEQLFVDEPYIPDGRYMIIGADGRLISGWMQSPLNVAPLAPGIYLLVNESKTWTKKFIKH